MSTIVHVREGGGLWNVHVDKMYVKDNWNLHFWKAKIMNYWKTAEKKFEDQIKNSISLRKYMSGENIDSSIYF